MNYIASIALFAACHTIGHSATINMSAGILCGTNTSDPIADGSLLQLVVSPTDSTFSPVVNGSFTTGDDIVLAQAYLDKDTYGIPGTTAWEIKLTYSGAVGKGDPILLRWFPTLTSDTTPPVFGTPYGQFRTDDAISYSETGWFLPSDDATISLNFATSSFFGGDSEDTLGIASYSITPVPEPSTYAAIFGALTLGGVCYRRYRRK